MAIRKPPHDDLYATAEKRIRKIKGFYTHLAIYLILNTLFIAYQFWHAPKGTGLFQWKYFSTAFFWGLGLLGHAAGIFGEFLVFSRKWEERQIRRYMEREKRERGE